MVFTKALLSISSSWKVNPNVGSGEDGLDLRSTGRRSVKGLIDNSNWLAGTIFFFRKGLYIINSLKILDIQGSIFHGQFIHDLIKSNMGGQLDYVGINIIVEQILGGMWIISKEDSFGYMILQLLFSLYRGLHIDTTSKGTRVGEVLLLGCSFLNWIVDCIRF